ncbi:hypothetical protein H6P81_001964 [Aristolochia fimbriata]|uniref:Large ribosomal subunit protein mL45 n=1 Tax=Aristolochia fimbriata TaxID=158543 RepID=A0AAV7FC86_ARIFI|nr:hypothetical protein H6P81_001964 [Aristolochia fimbriata]
MAWARARSSTIRLLYPSIGLRDVTSMIGISRSYSVSRANHGCVLSGLCSQGACNSKWSMSLSHNSRFGEPFKSSQAMEVSVFLQGMRSMSTLVKAPPQMQQAGAIRVSMVSPGIIYEPYAPREPISFWRRWFTRRGWRRTKEDFIMELKNAYAVAKLRKATGYSKQKFYEESIQLYKEINLLIANGDKSSLRKAVTENMYSALKNEIRQRESKWSSVYWELIEPVVKIRTLRARMIGIDKNDLNKAFVQLTLEFVTKQKFEAYDSKGKIVAGDKTKEVLVRDIWVFERSLFHPGSYWRLCGRISL